MRLDHVSYACGTDGVPAAVDRLAAAMGVPFLRGGVHPSFDTVNSILPLADGIYLEVVGVLEHPAAEKAPFGRAVKRRTTDGGGWLGWVVAVKDIAVVESRLGLDAVAAHRYRADGHELQWRQVGVRGFEADPQLPFFVQWEGSPQDHPSAAATGDVRLEKIEMAGDRDAIVAWLDEPAVDPLDGITLEWVDGPPGIVAAHFATPNGPVRIV